MSPRWRAPPAGLDSHPPPLHTPSLPCCHRFCRHHSCHCPGPAPLGGRSHGLPTTTLRRRWPRTVTRPQTATTARWSPPPASSGSNARRAVATLRTHFCLCHWPHCHCHQQGGAPPRQSCAEPAWSPRTMATGNNLASRRDATDRHEMRHPSRAYGTSIASSIPHWLQPPKRMREQWWTLSTSTPRRRGPMLPTMSPLAIVHVDFVGYPIVGFFIIPMHKMWDYFHPCPTEHPTIPHTKTLPEIGYLHLHM